MVPADTEVVAEIPGTDEQHVDTVAGGDLVGGATAAADSIWTTKSISCRPGPGAGVEPEPAGPVVGGHPTVPTRREPQVGQCRPSPRGTVHAGQHDSRGAVVQHPAHPDPLSVSTRTTVGTP